MSVLALLMAGAVVAAATVPHVPAGLVAWGRLFPWFGEPCALYVGEGVNASIAVTEESNGWRNFHVSGKVEASTEPQDMRLQRLLGHLTALMHEQGPKSASGRRLRRGRHRWRRQHPSLGREDGDLRTRAAHPAEWSRDTSET